MHGRRVGALAWGVGATEYAALIYAGLHLVVVPESIRFELTGALPPGVTAKDVMLYILATYAQAQQTLNRVMEFGGPGLSSLSPDERATLANMATECSAEARHRRGRRRDAARGSPRAAPARRSTALRAKVVAPDRGAGYAGGVHPIDLSTIRPMVATPGDPEQGIPSRSDERRLRRRRSATCAIDIAYGGSCTAGKRTTSTCTRA